jgi:hypothetical protein
LVGKTFALAFSEDLNNCNEARWQYFQRYSGDWEKIFKKELATLVTQIPFTFSFYVDEEHEKCRRGTFGDDMLKIVKEIQEKNISIFSLGWKH